MRRAIFNIVLVTAIWAVVAYLALYVATPKGAVAVIANLLLIETAVVALSTAYLFRVTLHVHEHSWLLILFTLSSLILFLGMVPASAAILLGTFEEVEPRAWAIALGLSTMFVGGASPYMAHGIWAHRNR